MVFGKRKEPSTPITDPFDSSDSSPSESSVVGHKIDNEHEEDGYFQQTWKGKIWDAFDRPKDERRFLFKVDAIVLTFASVSACTNATMPLHLYLRT